MIANLLDGLENFTCGEWDSPKFIYANGLQTKICSQQIGKLT
jgi:hypothetical protein